MKSTKSNFERLLNDRNKFLDRMIEAKAKTMLAEAAFIVYLNEQEQNKNVRLDI